MWDQVASCMRITVMSLPRSGCSSYRRGGGSAEAFIGMQGMNSRKATCRSRDDLLAELSDVIITAAVAMSGSLGRGEGSRSLRTAPGGGDRAAGL